MRNQFNQEKERISNEQNAARLKQDFEIEYLRKRLELDREHTPLTLQKYQIDSTERIYNRLNIKDIKINQFTGESKTNLLNLLPAAYAGLLPK